MKPKVLIVNRNRSQAEQLKHYLDPFFDVLIGTEPDLTLTLIGGLRPWSVVLSLQQTDRSGWMLARQLRKTAAGNSAYIVVHADPDNAVPSAFSDAGRPAYVNEFIPGEDLSWEGVRESLVGHAYATGVELGETEEDVRPPVRETGPVRRMNWARILTLPVTLHNIKAVVEGKL